MKIHSKFRHPKLWAIAIFVLCFGALSACNDSSPSSTTENETNPNAPTATAQTVSTRLYDPTSVTLVGTDPNGASLTYSIASSPTKGTVTGTPPNITYTASSGYSGTDSFTFKVNNGTSDSSAATVTVTIATPRDYYFRSSDFYDASEIDWTGLDNFNIFHWFLDSGFTVEASHSDPPTWGDRVYMPALGYAYQGYTTAPPAITLSSFEGGLGDTGTCSSYPVSGQCQTENLTIGAQGMLHIVSVDSDPDWGGDSTDSYWYGSTADATVSVTFDNRSRNYGHIRGDATFNGTSENHGTIDGDAHFNDSSQNVGGTIGGTCYGNDGSVNGTGC